MNGVDGSGTGRQVDGPGSGSHRGDRFGTAGDPPSAFGGVPSACEGELGVEGVPVGMAEPVGLEQLEEGLTGGDPGSPGDRFDR